MDSPTVKINDADVQGECPACHNPTLFLGAGGYVTCSLISCPDPEAASKLLDGKGPAKMAKDDPLTAVFTADDQRPMAAMLNRIIDTCRGKQARSFDGSWTDVDTLWPTEILNIIREGIS